jgi:MFS family permease
MSKQNLYYGWLVLGTCFFIIFCTFGVRTSTGVFVTSIESDMGWSRAEITRVFSIGILVGAFSFLVTGYLYDKYGGRIVIGFSLLMLGASIMASSVTNSMISFIVIWGFVVSFAGSGVSFVTINSLLARWFFRRRSLAISIAATGGSIGPVLFAPFSAYIIEAFDWRTGFLVLGGIIFVVVAPVAFAFLRSEPKASKKEDVSSNEDLEQVSGPLFTTGWRQALSTYPFWQLSIAYVVCGITTNIISIHFVPFAEDSGVPKFTAAAMFSVMMGLNFVGVLSAGFLSTRFRQKNVLGTTYALRGIAYALLLGVGGLEGMWVFAVVAGLSWIATASVTSVMTADIYGLKNIGVLNGMTNMAHQIGGAASVLMAGELQQITGSYTLPFSIAMLTLIGASIAAYGINEKTYSYRYNSAKSIFTNKDPEPVL